MNKIQLLATVQNLLSVNESLNAHELDSPNTALAYSYLDEGKQGAYGAVTEAVIRILTEVYGSEVRARRIYDDIIESGENLAYVVSGIRNDDHASYLTIEVDVINHPGTLIMRDASGEIQTTVRANTSGPACTVAEYVDMIALGFGYTVSDPWKSVSGVLVFTVTD